MINRKKENQAWNVYRQNSKRKNLEFSLTKMEFKKLVRSPCTYCDYSPGEGDLNGIDRLNNSEGYHTQNAVSCCFICNRAKNRMSAPEFYSWAMRLCLHGLKKGFFKFPRFILMKY